MEITCEIFGKPHPLPHATEGGSPVREAPGRGRGRSTARTFDRYLWELHPKVARNFPWSVFDWRHKRCNCNDCISKLERLTWKLRARFLGNHTRCHTQQRAAHQHARHRDEAGAGARHELSTGISGSFTQKSHVISLGQFSTSLTNVAIATTIFQNLKS